MIKDEEVKKLPGLLKNSNYSSQFTGKTLPYSLEEVMEKISFFNNEDDFIDHVDISKCHDGLFLIQIEKNRYKVIWLDSKGVIFDERECDTLLEAVKNKLIFWARGFWTNFKDDNLQ